MKVLTYEVVTRAFRAVIRVQNGRIVSAPRVVGSFEKRQLSELKDWLTKHHPGAWLNELREMNATDWAEAVANCLCKFSDVPDQHKEEVKALLSTLLDPSAPLPPMTMRNVTYIRRK